MGRYRRRLRRRACDDDRRFYGRASDLRQRVEVIDHVSGEVYRDFERKVNERVHQAFEDLARRNPAALLAVAEEQEKAREQAKQKAESA